jgi:hypothetical protein
MNKLAIVFFLGCLGCASKNTSDPVGDESELGFILKIDTTTILGHEYRGIATDGHKLFVLNSNSDTVLSNFDLYADFEFDDFNDDSLSDIIIPRSGNIPGLQDLLLFDVTKMGFTLVKNFDRFPDAKRIEGTDYYYSYHRSGCADNFWNSDLFSIDNFEAHILGDIAGNECEGDTGIVVYRIANRDTTAVDTFTLNVLESYDDRKWGFVADYWKKNYSKFAARPKTDDRGSHKSRVSR